jgi:hypothetical protein
MVGTVFVPTMHSYISGTNRPHQQVDAQCKTR